MWARTSEIALGAWLIVTSCLFAAGNPEWLGIGAGVAGGVIVAILALLSFRSSTRRAHLWTLVVAIALIGAGYFGSRSAADAIYQNEIYIGGVLLMLAIVPSEASLPPEGWRDSVQTE